MDGILGRDDVTLVGYLDHLTLGGIESHMPFTLPFL